MAKKKESPIKKTNSPKKVARKKTATKPKNKTIDKQSRIANLKGRDFRQNPQNINKKGRPRKWTSNLIDSGYSISEINDCIQNMLAMTESELKDIYRLTNEGSAKDRKNVTALELTIASALRKGIAKGDLSSLETLLSRRFGNPKSAIDHTIKQEQPLFP